MKISLTVLFFVLALVGCDQANVAEDDEREYDRLCELERNTLSQTQGCAQRELEQWLNEPAQVEARARAREYDHRASLLHQCQRADPLLDEVSNLEECERQLAELRAKRAAKRQAEDAKCKTRLHKASSSACESEEWCECAFRAEQAQARRPQKRQR